MTAQAAEPPADHDVVSNFRLATDCDTGDQIRPYLSFHLEVGAGTPESGRVVHGVGFQASPAALDNPDEFTIARDPAWFDAAGREFVDGEHYFPLESYASGDYEINLDYSAVRSTLEDDHFGATLYYADGSVAATDEIVVNCFNESGDTQLSDIDVTIVAGVPTTVRFRQYMLLSGVDGNGDTPRQVWVASPGLAWDADDRDQDKADDLVLDTGIRAALGATLADQVLKLDAPAAGDFTLEWGAVTTPLNDGEWTGGYGDRWGPAALRVHVVAAPGSTPADFDDVAPTNPFFDEITWLAQSGITEGYSDGTFRGTAPVARDAMAAFLYRAMHDDADAPACTATPFPDVALTNPFCGEITWLSDEGISTGYADGTFRPGAPVARDAMAAFIYRLVAVDTAAPACTTAPFTDVPTTHPFCAQVQWLKVNDLATGWPDGTFRPSATIERQAMAAFLFRLADGGFLDPK